MTHDEVLEPTAIVSVQLVVHLDVPYCAEDQVCVRTMVNDILTEAEKEIYALIHGPAQGDNPRVSVHSSPELVHVEMRVRKRYVAVPEEDHGGE